ncbi:TPA_asm: MC147R [Molluscum contagiosum virus]|nr:TPA_asm: MC147R [Molluscum contagiosum virus]DBA41708.1 TPA_asm: MC147R [Molluscum contagiosum virus]DBA41886.1 TPA_asm: MC147R [Molluscum contagiosum virus]DBA42064.1 TPA_asm: MC147R [Molluscum contagiosum virus]DBA42242.1 TPA_asm: MC147R [Molluscum contagiosum virus]
MSGTGRLSTAGPCTQLGSGMESFSPEVRVRPVLLVVGSRLGLAFLHTDVHKANPEPDLECRDGDGHSKSFFFTSRRTPRLWRHGDVWGWPRDVGARPEQKVNFYAKRTSC